MKVNVHPSTSTAHPRLLIARILIFIVFSLNIFCAIQFLRQPSTFAPSFNLSGEAGIVVIQSLGVLFLMWNVPYGIAILQPARYFVALVSAVIMQGIGVLGESWIYFQIQSLSDAKSSIMRFIWFDAAGLILIFFAMLLIMEKRKYG